MITIIVPVHNTEKYLEACLDSLVNQVYRDIEIICVDSSTDSSKLILERYRSLDKRIRVIFDDNSSYGYKINLGIHLSKGNYIGFVDSDDFVSNDMFSSLFSFMERYPIDYVKADYFCFRNTESEYQIGKCCEDENLYNRIINAKCAPGLVSKTNICYWSGLYRKDFLVKKGILMHESQGASFQDSSFAIQTSIFASAAMLIHEKFYYYRTDNESSSVKDSGKKYVVADELMWLERILNKKGIDTYIYSLFFRKVLYIYTWNFYRWGQENGVLFCKYIHEWLERFRSSIYFDSLEKEYEDYYNLLNFPCDIKQRELAEKYGLEPRHCQNVEPLFTIIVINNNRNSSENRNKTIRSIVEQKFSAIQIILVSIDSQDEVCELGKIDNRFTFRLVNKNNFASQMNRIVDEARGKYVLLLNNNVYMNGLFFSRMKTLVSEKAYECICFEGEVLTVDNMFMNDASYQYYSLEKTGVVSGRELTNYLKGKRKGWNLLLPIMLNCQSLKERHVVFSKEDCESIEHMEEKCVSIFPQIFCLKEKWFGVMLYGTLSDYSKTD